MKEIFGVALVLVGALIGFGTFIVLSMLIKNGMSASVELHKEDAYLFAFYAIAFLVGVSLIGIGSRFVIERKKETHTAESERWIVAQQDKTSVSLEKKTTNQD